MNNYLTSIIVGCISTLFLIPVLFILLENENREYAYEKKNENSTTSSSGHGNLEEGLDVSASTNSITSSSTSTIDNSTSTDVTTTTVSSSQVISTSSESVSTPARKEKVYFEVPFTPQAPTANWEDPRQQNACEEAAVLMAMKWVRGESLSTQEALQEIIKMTEFAEDRYGAHRDLSASTTHDLVKNYFDFDNVELVYDISVEDIITELERGRVVSVPVDGTLLGNPHFVPPGPKEHMITIHGFDREAEEFITHDPGTKRGNDFRYSFDTIEQSLRDYNTGYHEPISEKRTAMISFQKDTVSDSENTVSIGDKKIQVEVAKTQKEKTKGLSGRKSLPEDQGMLFINEEPAKSSIWMKDMNFAIDIIWIDENQKVIGVEKEVSPDTYPNKFRPSEPVKYILEVNAGFVDRNNIAEGSKLVR